MGIEDRKARLRAEIERDRRAAEAALARKTRELEKLDALPDFEELADGTVAALFVTLGRSRPYIVVAFRNRGLWYLTGETSPNGVSSDALAEWLSTSGRCLVSAAVLAEIETVTPSVDLGALLGALTGDPPGMGYGSGYHPYDG